MAEIVALLKYYVEDELYSRYVFVHNGEYYVHSDNQGNVLFANCDIREEEKWIDIDTCYSLGISADTPVSECESDIIYSFYEALKEEDEFQYLTDTNKTHLEY